MPVTNTPVASSAVASNTVASNAVASNTVASTTVALTPLIATPVQSTTAPATEKAPKRPCIKIEISEKIELQNLDQLYEIQDDVMKRAVEISVSKIGFEKEIIDFFAKTNHTFY